MARSGGPRHAGNEGGARRIKTQTTETFGDDGSGPPTPPWDKAREVRTKAVALNGASSILCNLQNIIFVSFSINH
ncbi:hypothetical protein ElyMa_002954700 [Elysia marginata]|uniref:Uncharacterized protein n=1 Tax=Elysia marginata TaxID=1093978 RepID=A0AAV4I6P4_9GAST|nr:hypothetical protein ElyMa_002954700 [Elysia marginata]